MATLARPGAVIHYEIWGEDAAAPWVLLVNGHTRPLNDYRLMGRHLVEQGFRCVALDNRGAGTTETTRSFGFADMVSDLVAVLDAAGAAEAGVVGISMGGFLAQELALAEPQRVKKLVLVSTAASQRMIRKDDAPWTQNLHEVEQKLSPYFTAEFARKNEVLVKSMVKQIAKAVGEGAFADRSEDQRQAAAGFDSRARLIGLSRPTIVIHGSEDAIIPIEAGHELARLIAGAQLTELAGAGHLLLAERPKELYRLISAFLAP